MIKVELLLCEVPFNFSWGTRKLTHAFKEYKIMTSEGTNAFFPRFCGADNWISPENVQLEDRKVNIQYQKNTFGLCKK